MPSATAVMRCLQVVFEVLPTALKRVCYNTPDEKAAAMNDVEVRKQYMGRSNTVQCLTDCENMGRTRTFLVDHHIPCNTLATHF